MARSMPPATPSAATASSVEVLAESEVHLLEVPVAAMERLLERHPALAQRVDMIVEARTAALADSLAGNGDADRLRLSSPLRRPKRSGDLPLPLEALLAARRDDPLPSAMRRVP